MPWSFVTSLAGPSLIALLGVGALYVLHHLKTQSKRQVVETLLFWAVADVHPAAKSLWSNRLRQPLAMLLLSTIVLLLAAALAIAHWKSLHEPINAVVFDAGTDSASLSDLNLSPDFERSVDETLTTDPVLLIAAAEQPRVIANTDEPVAVARLRLKHLRLSQTASASSLALLLATDMQGPVGGKIDWFTSQSALPADLPPALASRVRRHWVKPDSDRLSIADLAFEPNQSDPTSGTLIVEVGCETPKSTGTVRITPDGLQPQSLSVDMSPHETTPARFERLSADGRSVLVTLSSSTSKVEPVQAEFTLPRRSSPRFFGIRNAPTALRKALLCLGPSVAKSQGAIAIVNRGDMVPADAAGALVIVPDSGTTQSLLLEAEQSTITRGIGFQNSMAVIGTGKLPGGAVILSAGGHAVISADLSAPQPVVYLLDSSISQNASLPRLIAFPLLMQRLCDTLIHTAPASAVATSLRHVEDPLWHGLKTENAGSPVSVVDPLPVTIEAGGTNQLTEPVQPDGMKPYHRDWVYLLLCTVVALLITEVILFRRKVIA